jgi:hypothetical protein
VNNGKFSGVYLFVGSDQIPKNNTDDYADKGKKKFYPRYAVEKLYLKRKTYQGNQRCIDSNKIIICLLPSIAYFLNALDKNLILFKKMIFVFWTIRIFIHRK